MSIPTQPDNEKVSGIDPIAPNVPVPPPADNKENTTDTGHGEPPKSAS